MSRYTVSENGRCSSDTCRGRCRFAAVMSRPPARVYSPPLGLADNPDYSRYDQGQEQPPEEQREQDAKQATPHHPAAHHLSHAAHHAVAHPAAGEAPDEQQGEYRPAQGSKKYLQAVAHDPSTSFSGRYFSNVTPWGRIDLSKMA